MQETQNDTNDVDPNPTTGDNYWGYMTLNYFAPDRRYASDKTAGRPDARVQGDGEGVPRRRASRSTSTWSTTTPARAGPGRRRTDGLTVYNLSVVPRPRQPDLLRAHQRPAELLGQHRRRRQLQHRNPAAQNLIVDSLAYWRDTLGVDGFRFDLASVLGNTCSTAASTSTRWTRATRSTASSPSCRRAPAAGGTGVDLIAEPWAIGGNTYQVGNFPPAGRSGTASTATPSARHQNKLGVGAVTPGTLATRFAGSSDLYGDDGRKPWNSVNFMVAHDGFTLNDLYVRNGKNNGQAWPYGPSDGGEDNNNSWDQGGVAVDQRKAARTGLASDDGSAPACR